MAIYDNNGTASAEIGKLYDNNGTASVQISKVYDNNGTANSLLYSAAEPFTVVPNASGYPASKYTLTVLAGSHNADQPYCKYNGNTLEIYINGWSKMFQGFFTPITIAGQTKMKVNGTTWDPGNSSTGWTTYVKLCSAKTQAGITGGIGCATACSEDGSATLSGTFDISSLGDGTKYLFIGMAKTSSSDAVRGHINITSLTFSE